MELKDSSSSIINLLPISWAVDYDLSIKLGLIQENLTESEKIGVKSR